jgi:hypothetical protein
MVIADTVEANLQNTMDNMSAGKWQLTYHKQQEDKNNIIQEERKDHKEHTMYCDGKKVESVLSFKYLIITMKYRNSLFNTCLPTMHSSYKGNEWHWWVRKILNEHHFEALQPKIHVFTYGFDVIWTHPTAISFRNLENLIEIYLKKIMRLSNFTPSRLI